MRRRDSGVGCGGRAGVETRNTQGGGPSRGFPGAPAARRGPRRPVGRRSCRKERGRAPGPHAVDSPTAGNGRDGWKDDHRGDRGASLRNTARGTPGIGGLAAYYRTSACLDAARRRGPWVRQRKCCAVPGVPRALVLSGCEECEAEEGVSRAVQRTGRMTLGCLSFESERAPNIRRHHRA